MGHQEGISTSSVQGVVILVLCDLRYGMEEEAERDRLDAVVAMDTSGFPQHPLHQAVGRREVNGPLALRVPDGAVGPVLHQDGHHLGAGQTRGRVQRGVAVQAAVHTGA